MLDFIKVDYEYYTTKFSITKALDKLSSLDVLSCDFEVQSIYSLDERAEAKDLIKKNLDELNSEDMRLTKVVAKSSGLSYPSITKITHCIFGTSENHSVILIINDKRTEQLVMNWVVKYKGKLLFHNAGFDMKLVYHRTGKFPKDYEDTQLLARCLINHTKDWFCKTGLKHLMSKDYDPRWFNSIESYDIVDLKNEAFLRYCSIDGASTFKLWNDIQETLDE